jgi:hypothetical protein
MWDYCGMSRNARTASGTRLERIRDLREEFWSNVNVPGSGEDLNQSLENAGRVADFLELAELMCLDALDRNEAAAAISARNSRRRRRSPARRRHFSYVAAWEYAGPDRAPAASQGAAGIRVRASRRNGVTNDRVMNQAELLHVWRQKNAVGRAACSAMRRATSIPICRSSRCSTSSTKG